MKKSQVQLDKLKEPNLLAKKWYPNSTGRENPGTSRFAIANNINPPPNISIRANQIKLPNIIPLSQKKNNKLSPIKNLISPKKWYLNSKENQVKLPNIRQLKEKLSPNKTFVTSKKWYPNSTGRELPMTSKFGIENNYQIEHLRPTPIQVPNEKMIKVEILCNSPIQDGPKGPIKKKKLNYLWGLVFHSPL